MAVATVAAVNNTRCNVDIIENGHDIKQLLKQLFSSPSFLCARFSGGTSQRDADLVEHSCCGLL
jgi:hypothetical protein